MRLSIISIIFTAAGVCGQVNQFKFHRELSPKDVGSYHTDAFNKLGEIYKSKKPRNKIDAMKDVANIVSAYCPIDDFECKANAHMKVLDEFHSVQNGLKEIIYPEDFDSNAKDAMELALFLVRSIDEENIFDVVDKLTQIQSDLENMDDEKGHIIGALATLSVAIESSQLWHSAINDPEHNLHEIVMMTIGNNRRLQYNIVLPLYDGAKIIEADVTSTILAFVTTNPANYFQVVGPAKILVEMVLQSISGSAAMALNTTESDFLYP